MTFPVAVTVAGHADCLAVWHVDSLYHYRRGHKKS